MEYLNKGALSRGFWCVKVNSVLKQLLSTFTCTQNDLFRTQLENLKKMANVFKFQSISILAIHNNKQQENSFNAVI